MKKIYLALFVFVVIFCNFGVIYAQETSFDLNKSVGNRVQPMEYIVSPDKETTAFIARVTDEIGYDSYSIFTFDTKNEKLQTVTSLNNYSVGGDVPLVGLSNSYLATKESNERGGVAWMPGFIRKIFGIDLFVSNLKIYNTSNQKLVKLIKVNGSIGNVSFSPDGEKLWYEQLSSDATTRDDSKILIYNIQSGEINKLGKIKCAFLNWFPDSENIICAKPESSAEYRSYNDFPNQIYKFNISSGQYENLGFTGLNSVFEAEWIIPGKTVLVSPSNVATDQSFYIFDLSTKQSTKLDVRRAYGSGDHVINNDGFVAFTDNPENLDANRNRANRIRVFNDSGAIVNDETFTAPFTTSIYIQGVTNNGNYLYHTNYCTNTYNRPSRIYELVYNDKLNNVKKTIFQSVDSDDGCGGSMRIPRNYYDDIRNMVINLDEGKISFYPVN